MTPGGCKPNGSLLPKVIGEELGVDQNDLEKSFAVRVLGSFQIALSAEASTASTQCTLRPSPPLKPGGESR